ncbi:MAG TPA: RluA family pseudouridine synthase [Tepidisphaeraceae bacterium]|nr:RluA family pseudouridine synthase [Tepidisphaeraceae bacterium]
MPQTVLDWLVRRFPAAKRQNLKRMTQAGRVRINGRPAKTLRQILADSDDVTLTDKAPKTPPPAPAGLRIIYEDDDLLVADKPAGLLTSTGPREKRETLWAMVRQYLHSREPAARPGLIHRLDRDASGILVFSKGDLAYQSLKTQFFKHAVEREYTALVHGTPEPREGRIETHLVERTDGSVHSTRQIGKGQLAITRYETIESAGKRSLLRVFLETGRKHQIRVQLSERQTPIVGDSVYGREDDAARLMLAATRLTIQHPRDGKRMAFKVPAPAEFRPLRLEKAPGETVKSRTSDTDGDPKTLA